jgi:hypothetical protein
MVMKLVFTKNSPLNTTLVDETSGAVLYEIETKRSFWSKATVIRKPFLSAPFGSLSPFSPLTRHWKLIVIRSAGRVRISHLYRSCEDPVEGMVVRPNHILRARYEESGIYAQSEDVQVSYSPKLSVKLATTLTPDFSSYFITVNGTKYRWSTGTFGRSLPKVACDIFDTDLSYPRLMGDMHS